MKYHEEFKAIQIIDYKKVQDSSLKVRTSECKSTLWLSEGGELEYEWELYHDFLLPEASIFITRL